MRAAEAYERSGRQDLAKKLRESKKFWAALVDRYEYLKNTNKLHYVTEGLSDATDVLHEYIPNSESIEFAENMLTCTGFNELSNGKEINPQGEIMQKKSWMKIINADIGKRYVYAKFLWKNEGQKPINQSMAHIIMTLK